MIPKWSPRSASLQQGAARRSPWVQPCLHLYQPQTLLVSPQIPIAAPTNPICTIPNPHCSTNSHKPSLHHPKTLLDHPNPPLHTPNPLCTPQTPLCITSNPLFTPQTSFAHPKPPCTTKYLIYYGSEPGRIRRHRKKKLLCESEGGDFAPTETSFCPFSGKNLVHQNTQTPLTRPGHQDRECAACPTPSHFPMAKVSSASSSEILPRFHPGRPPGMNLTQPRWVPGFWGPWGDAIRGNQVGKPRHRAMAKLLVPNPDPQRGQGEHRQRQQLVAIAFSELKQRRKKKKKEKKNTPRIQILTPNDPLRASAQHDPHSAGTEHAGTRRDGETGGDLIQAQ